MATTVHERRIALDEIRVPENVRALDDAHVQALAGSIALQGMLVPLVVRGDGDGFELVAGFHRIAAARSLGLVDVPVVIRDTGTEDADREVENITRARKMVAAGRLKKVIAYHFWVPGYDNWGTFKAVSYTHLTLPTTPYV